MTWQWTPRIIPLMVTALLSTMAAFYVLWKRRHLPASRLTILLLAAGIVWMVGSAMQLASTGLAAKILWEKVQGVGMEVIPTAWLAYVLRYTGRDRWLNPRNRILLSIIPLVTFLLAVTNETHHLIWRDFWLDTSGPNVIKHAPYGVAAWVYMFYAYVLVLIGVLLLLRTLARAGRLYRWQAGVVLVAVLAPWFTNVVEQFVTVPVVGDMALTPLALGLTIPVVAWSFSRLQLRDIVPVARVTVVEGMTDALLVLDSENRVVDLNPAAQRLLGRPRSEALGQPLERLWPEWLTGLGDEIAPNRELVVEQNGEQRVYDLRTSPLTDWRGRVLSQVLVLHDVTERKRAEAALRASEEQYRLLAENVRDAIWTMDLDLNITYVSPSIHNLGGFTAEELIGQSARITVTADSFQRGLQLLADELDQEGSLEPPDPNRSRILEFEQVGKDGSIIPVEVRISFLRDAAGQPTGILGVTRDITERKRAEEQLRRYAAELERSNQELQQFAYVASHDLQEPLRMVTSYLQLLERRYQGQLDADADEFIHFAVDGAQRMYELIRGLLAYSRVGTHGGPFVPVDCEEIVGQVLDNLQIVIGENQATVTYDPLPTVRADPTQMAQLFQNLIGNALKFRGQRPPEIHVGAEWQGDEWLFRVCDNGIGIEIQYAERIFVIFQRLHTREEYPGTGIGLALCKRIVERHGGRIWVESEPGQGSCFFFTLPDGE
jgi:PAS domain S-box-containing protein